jgi:hypothetical protein
MKTMRVFALVLTAVVTMPAQDYHVGWQVSGCGGGRMASTSYAAGVTAGQTGVGNIGSPSFLAVIGFWQAQLVVGLADDKLGPKPLSLETGLGTIAPNPMVGGTRISYALATPARVLLRVYDPSGRAIRTLTDADMSPGRHEVEWDWTDHQGRSAPEGIYFCRFVSGNLLESCKLVVQRQGSPTH